MICSLVISQSVDSDRNIINSLVLDNHNLIGNNSFSPLQYHTFYGTNNEDIPDYERSITINHKAYDYTQNISNKRIILSYLLYLLADGTVPSSNKLVAHNILSKNFSGEGSLLYTSCLFKK